MKPITTIKHSPVQKDDYIIYNGDDEIIATARKQQPHHENYKFGTYLVAMVGGAAHGKISYAQDWEQLNEKSVNIAKLHAQTA